MEQGKVREDPRHATGDRKTSKLKLVNWYMGKNTAALAKELYGDEVGQHATPDEVSQGRGHVFFVSLASSVVPHVSPTKRRDFGRGLPRNPSMCRGLVRGRIALENPRYRQRGY